MGCTSAAGFGLFGFSVRIFVVVVVGFFPFFFFFSQNLPSSFCSVTDLCRCSYLYKVTVNHVSSLSFVSCYDRDFKK